MSHLCTNQAAHHELLTLQDRLNGEFNLMPAPPHYLWTLVYGVKSDPSPDEKDLAIYRLVFERRASVWP